MDTMKRPSSSESGLPIKKIKSQPMVALDENDDDFALARLRCLGMDVNENTQLATVKSEISQVEEKEKEKSTRSIRKSYLSSQEEKDLRRERGELLLKLFREVPWLADSASARRAEKNQERAQMWDKITNKVNESFGSRLEVLTVDKVKKLLTYYKKKDDGSYDNIKLNNSQLLLEDDPITTCSVPHSINGSVNGDSAENGEDGDDDGIKGLVIIEERTDANKELMDFIAAIGSSASEDRISKGEISSPHTVATSEGLYQLKKERHDYVVGLAEYYMDRMCFDNSSRSAAVNAERHNMWIKITHKANEKFANGLGPLGVEQAKKLFSNCKRRRRVRQEKFGEETQTASIQSLQSHSRDSNSLEPDDINDISSVLDDTSEYNVAPPITNFEDLIRGLDRSVEIDELKRQLADRDTEIERLKKKIIEQADDYRNRVKSMMELLKVAVDKKVSEDIINFLAT